MTSLALALVALGALGFAAFFLHLREQRNVRAEARVETVSTEDFLSLQRAVLALKSDVERLQAARAFGGR